MSVGNSSPGNSTGGGIAWYGAGCTMRNVTVLNFQGYNGLRTEFPPGGNPLPIGIQNVYENILALYGSYGSGGTTGSADNNNSAIFNNGPTDSLWWGGTAGFSEGFTLRRTGAWGAGAMYKSVHDATQPSPSGEQTTWSHVIEGGNVFWEGCTSEGGTYGQILMRASGVFIRGGNQYSYGIGVQVGDTGFQGAYNYVIDTFLNTGTASSPGTAIFFQNDAGGLISVNGYCPGGYAYAGQPSMNTFGNGMLIAAVNTTPPIPAGSSSLPTFVMDALMYARPYANDTAAKDAGVQTGERYFNTTIGAITVRVSQ